MLSKRVILTSISILILILLAYQGGKAAVDLEYFTATSQENGILLEWKTGTELDNIGFYVTRSTNPVDSYETISDFIEAQGDGILGAKYEYLDEDVTNDVLYFYILEAIDANQGIEKNGPITATFSGQPANTHTPTPTITNTPTKTNTPTSTRTPTQTRTGIPTRTSTPAPPTLTPTAFTETPTPSPTFTITPSPTLLDAPAIILQLPTGTDTPLPTLGIATPVPALKETPTGLLNRLTESNSVLVVGAICLFGLVWAAIAIAVFIYLQRRNS